MFVMFHLDNINCLGHHDISWVYIIVGIHVAISSVCYKYMWMLLNMKTRNKNITCYINIVIRLDSVSLT